MPTVKILTLAAVMLAIAMPAHAADQVLETKQYPTAAACQYVAAIAAGELRKSLRTALGKDIDVVTIMQTRSAVVYKAAYSGASAFVTCDGPNFKSWVMN